MKVDTTALEHAVEEMVDIATTIEVSGDTLVVTGFIETPEERQAILDILGELEPEAQIQDNLAVGAVMPEELGSMKVSEEEAAGLPGAQAGLRESENVEPGDFTDQHLLEDQSVASGPSGTHADDDVAEGDEVYVPPTDPPRAPSGEFAGGFQTTADQAPPHPAAGTTTGRPTDASIEETVLVRLREDAATTALEVAVSVSGAVVHLRGIVDDIEDANNAQAVAAQVPGVVEVRDELEVRANQQGGPP